MHSNKQLFSNAAKILRRFGYSAQVEEEGKQDWILYVDSLEGDSGEGFFQASIEGDVGENDFTLLLTNPDKEWEYLGLGGDGGLALAEFIVQFDTGSYWDLSATVPARFKRWIKGPAE